MTVYPLYGNIVYVHKINFGKWAQSSFVRHYWWLIHKNIFTTFRKAERVLLLNDCHYANWVSVYVSLWTSDHPLLYCLCYPPYFLFYCSLNVLEDRLTSAISAVHNNSSSSCSMRLAGSFFFFFFFCLVIPNQKNQKKIKNKNKKVDK